jgi:hypothetical protein
LPTLSLFAKSSIRIEAFSNVKRMESFDQNSVRIFARLSAGNMPVIGATVMALIHRLFGNFYEAKNLLKCRFKRNMDETENNCKTMLINLK